MKLFLMLLFLTNSLMAAEITLHEKDLEIDGRMPHRDFYGKGDSENADKICQHFGYASASDYSGLYPVSIEGGKLIKLFGCGSSNPNCMYVDFPKAKTYEIVTSENGDHRVKRHLMKNTFFSWISCLDDN